jgi:hypothetical protein
VEVQPTFRKNISRKITQKIRYVYALQRVSGKLYMYGSEFFSLWVLYLGKMSSIRLNCFLHGGTVNNIFNVEIDNNLSVGALKDQIRNVRQDLRQENFDLYEVNFFQPNFSIVSSVNSFTIRQGVFMVPQREISNYFSTLCINTLIEKPPYPQENGERGVIHVLIYPQN